VRAHAVVEAKNMAKRGVCYVDEDVSFWSLYCLAHWRIVAEYGQFGLFRAQAGRGRRR